METSRQGFNLSQQPVPSLPAPAPGDAAGETPAADDRLHDPGDHSLPMEEAARLAAWISLPIAAAGLLPHIGIWGWDSLWLGFRTVFTLWYFIPGLVLTVLLHEGLHAVGFRLVGRAPAGSVHFGIDRTTYSPYAGCHATMSARAYRVALLLPALLMGFVPLVLGWFGGIGWLTVLGTLQLLAAAGDFVTYHAFRTVPGTSRVLDSPHRVGCRVVDG